MISDRFLGRLYERDKRWERSFTSGDEHDRRRLYRATGLRFLTFIAAWVVYLVSYDFEAEFLIGAFVAGAFFGLGAVGFASKPTNRAVGYRNGMVDGRLELLESWEEARARGLDVHDWQHAEKHRTWSMFL